MGTARAPGCRVGSLLPRVELKGFELILVWHCAHPFIIVILRFDSYADRLIRHPSTDIRVRWFCIRSASVI